MTANFLKLQSMKLAAGGSKRQLSDGKVKCEAGRGNCQVPRGKDDVRKGTANRL